MPFCLVNAGVKFQHAMHIAFDDMIGIILQVYLDDLMVHSRFCTDHFSHLRQFFLHCRKYGMSLNPNKSIFGGAAGKILGHVVSEAGISIDPKRVKAISVVPYPTSKKSIQAFMGKINFVRRSIPNFAFIVKPIHNLLKANQTCVWNKQANKSFLKIKDALSSAPVLATPNFSKDFILHTNATEEAIAAILMQKKLQNDEQPIAFMSQSLSDVAIQYRLIEKHAYALVKAIEKFRHYILGKHTIVKVPLHAVKYLLSQTYLSGNLANWLTKFQEHDLSIETVNTIKGRGLALHLSQHSVPSSNYELEDGDDSNLFFADMIPSDLSNHPWYNDILYYLNHEKCLENLNSHQRRKLQFNSSKYFIVNNHLFRRSYDGLLLRCIDDHGAQDVLESMHGSLHDVLPSGRHFVAKSTAHKILTSGYYWPTLFHDSHLFVLSCDSCQQSSRRQKLSVFPPKPVIATSPFEKWGLDFIGPINPHSSAGHMFILTMTDYFSKWSEVIPLKNVKDE